MSESDNEVRFEVTPGAVRLVIPTEERLIRLQISDEQAADIARGLSLAAIQAKDMLEPPPVPGEDPVWLVPYATLEEIGHVPDGTIALRFVDENQVEFRVRIEATSARVLAQMIVDGLPEEEIPPPADRQ